MQLKGQQLNRYRLEGLVGKGGMGSVYHAKDTHIDREVAIKVLEIGDDKAKKNFQHEMKTIGRLDHPHILPLYDYGEDKVDGLEISYMVMPFFREGSLKTWLAKRPDRRLSLYEVDHFLQQVASALQYAHDEHIIHRDVKPDNLLVRSNQDHPDHPDVLLADFGIAKFTATTMMTDERLRGTAPYMAPELWNTEPILDGNQPRIDQYALATTAYELLTGHYPFQGNSLQLAPQHISRLPDPPSKVNPNIPDTIDRVILRALAKNPQERFASIADFAKAFQQAVQSTQIGPPLHMVLTISRTEALLGTTYPLALPGPGNRKVTVTVPPGSQDGQILPPLDSQGQPLYPGGPCGPLIVTIAVKPNTEHDQMMTDLQHLVRQVVLSHTHSTAMTSRTKLLRGLQVTLVVILLICSILATTGIFNRITDVQKQMSIQIASVKTQISNPTTSSTCGALSNAFKGKDLGPEWDKKDLGKATYKIGQNSLTMKIDPKGEQYDLWSDNHNTKAPRLLQPVHDNFTVRTVVNFLPSDQYQGSGILIWQDDHNFLRLERQYASSGLFFGAVKDGHTQGGDPTADLPAGQVTRFTQVGLMLQRVDNHFTGWYWSTPDQSWQKIGSFDNLGFTNISVGLDLVDTAATQATATYNNFTVSCD